MLGKLIASGKGIQVYMQLVGNETCGSKIGKVFAPYEGGEILTVLKNEKPSKIIYRQRLQTWNVPNIENISGDAYFNRAYSKLLKETPYGYGEKSLDCTDYLAVNHKTTVINLETGDTTTMYQFLQRNKEHNPLETFVKEKVSSTGEVLDRYSHASYYEDSGFIKTIFSHKNFFTQMMQKFRKLGFGGYPADKPVLVSKTVSKSD